MPNNPTLSTKTLLWSCRSSGFASSTEETRPSRPCEGFYSSYPAILGDQGSVFSYLSFQNNRKPTWISSGKRGVHTKALRVHSLPASNVATVPKACQETSEASPPTPPSHPVQNTQVKMSSSEALQNSQSLALEAKKKPHIQKIHG